MGGQIITNDYICVISLLVMRGVPDRYWSGRRAWEEPDADVGGRRRPGGRLMRAMSGINRGKGTCG
jgi:hypothetical protein